MAVKGEKVNIISQYNGCIYRVSNIISYPPPCRTTAAKGDQYNIIIQLLYLSCK